MGNSVKGTQEGTSSLHFTSDGATVTWTLPTIHIRGVCRQPAVTTNVNLLSVLPR